MPQPFIKLKNVDLYYDKGKQAEVHALKDINLEINEGEYVAFFGPSGCGKSSLLYAIAGIEKLSNGTAILNNHDIGSITSLEMSHIRQHEMGMVFQSFNLVPSLSVLENVMLPMVFVGINVETRRKRALELLKRFDIEHLAKRLPSELSGGQQQRVGIARSLANDPKLILADEPLGNLDSKNAIAALDLLNELHAKDNRTVIIVTHEAWSLRDAEKIFYMKDGAIINMEQRKVPKSNQKTEITVSGAYQKIHPEIAQDIVNIKSLSDTILRGYPPEETKRFEFFLLHLVQGKLETDEFADLLDLSFSEGGVGLWKPTALRIASKVATIIKEWNHVDRLLAKLAKEPETSLAADVQSIRFVLAQNYGGLLSAEQTARLDEIIENRIRKIISAKNFKEILTLPAGKNGVGIHRTTAEKIAEQMELFVENRIIIKL